MLAALVLVAPRCAAIVACQGTSRQQQDAPRIRGIILLIPSWMQFLGVCACPPAIVTGEHCYVGRLCCAVVRRLPHPLRNRPTAHLARAGTGCPAGVPARQTVVLPAPLHPSAHLPRSSPAEYCSRGSLTHVLQEAAQSPQKAALLTWPRRLRMVRRDAAPEGVGEVWTVPTRVGMPTHGCGSVSQPALQSAHVHAWVSQGTWPACMFFAWLCLASAVRRRLLTFCFLGPFPAGAGCGQGHAIPVSFGVPVFTAQRVIACC